MGNINQVVTDSELQDLKQRYRFDRTVTRILEALECERADGKRIEKLQSELDRVSADYWESYKRETQLDEQLAEKTSQLASAEELLHRLSREVMNIRGDSEKLWVAGYRNGHRDARHAAAELVNECLVKLDPTPASAGTAGEHVG